MRLDCDEMDRQVLGRPVTRESGELWIDLEEDKTARAVAFGLLAEIEEEVAGLTASRYPALWERKLDGLTAVLLCGSVPPTWSRRLPINGIVQRPPPGRRNSSTAGFRLRSTIR
jgi:hypothetical protein